MAGKTSPNPHLLSYEVVYQLTQQKEWERLIILLHEHHKAIESDEMLGRAFKAFEFEFVANMENGDHDENLEKHLSGLQLLQVGKMYHFEDVNHKKIILQLVKLNQTSGNLDSAAYYARYYPEEEICKAAILAYEESLPKVIKHTQGQTISVTENRNINTVNYTRSLFKSQQEADFFMVVRETFPMLLVYPNVAMSSVFDFDSLKPVLTGEQRDYFLKAIIDCVVVDFRFAHDYGGFADSTSSRV